MKIDVEGHELNVLNGAVELLERCQPVFLVEAEDRHRAEATRLVFEFFRSKSYRGFFLKDMPSGLVLYWLFSNLLTIVQQLVMNRIVKEDDSSPPPR